MRIRNNDVLKILTFCWFVVQRCTTMLKWLYNLVSTINRICESDLFSDLGVNGQMSEPSSKKPYYYTNKQFHAWLENDLFEWFIKYLDKYSYGNSRSDKFRVFLYELQKQEEKGISFKNFLGI